LAIHLRGWGGWMTGLSLRQWGEKLNNEGKRLGGRRGLFSSLGNDREKRETRFKWVHEKGSFSRGVLGKGQRVSSANTGEKVNEQRGWRVVFTVPGRTGFKRGVECIALGEYSEGGGSRLSERTGVGQKKKH